MKKTLLSVLIIAAISATKVFGQAQLVKDVNTDVAVNGSNPVYFTKVASTYYFAADDGNNGNELWKTDGTIGGTSIVKDINPGPTGSGSSNMVNLNNTLYFASSDGTTGLELWKSDGTAAGTVLVKDIQTGAGGSGPFGLVVMNSVIYFSANDGVNGTELWKSDGTALGTVMVKDIFPGAGSSGAYGITPIGNTLYLSASDGVNGYELWKSDGSTLGTSLVKDILPGASGSGCNSFVALGATVYFIANDGTTGQELWKTNGTGIGTSLVKDIYPGANGSLLFYNLVNYNGALVFTAYTGTNGSELWTSNGTAAGTTMVKDINPGVADGAVGTPIISNNILFFLANDGVTGSELWISDGSSAGTGQVKDIYPGATGSSIYLYGMTDINGTLYFTGEEGVNGRELWRSDGTSGGTIMIKDIEPGSGGSFPNYFIAGPGFALFQAANSTAGTELWKSDGSLAGTIMLKNIYPDVSNSSIYNIVAAGSNVFFSAYEGVYGNEVWKSDGTTGGTSVVKDIYPGAIGCNPNNITPVNNKVYFSGGDGVSGYELWASDGTVSGTNMVKDIVPGAASGWPQALVNINDTLYFFADQSASGTELWKSDGTVGGTGLIKDVNPGTGGSLWSGEMKNMNGQLYFAPQTNTNGEEPWISHGTAANTLLIKDINTACAGCGSSLSDFCYSNGLTFFGANNGVNGYELWKTNGTTAGTVMVKDIKAGSGGGLISYFNNGCMSSCSANIADANNILFFIADDGTGTGSELWKSDGTSGGTMMVKDIYPGSLSSSPDNLINIGGTLYFTANDGTNGIELWKTDGTTGGTVMIKDIYPGSSGSAPSTLTNFGGKLFFAASDGLYGYELWTSQGTSATTARVSDIYTGAGSSSPGYLTQMANTLFFTANDGLIGTELWKLDMPAVLTNSALVSNISCNGLTDGAINITVNGGTAPYTYVWSSGQTTQNISGVAAGAYTVTVTDNWGWTSVGIYSITAPAILSVSLASQTNVTCNNGTNGAININVSGGTTAYTYLWSPGGATTQNISSLAATTYSVLVTDANSCTKTFSVTLSQPPALSGSVVVVDASCFGATNGNLTVNMSVGALPFTYQWSANAASQTTQTASGLSLGTYSVIVTDNTLCSTSFTANVNQPAILNMSVTSTVDTCGLADGTAAVVSPTGGTSPYTYSWSGGGGSSQTASGLNSGTYSVTMTDSKGCVKVGSVNVGSVPQRPVSICMVTVDSASANNIIYWDKTGNTSVDSFIVYREVSTGTYKRIGSQHYSVLSQFTDTDRSIGPANGDPNIGSYRYKLQMRDVCGNYSLLSPYHNTVYFIDNHTGTFQWNTYLVEGQVNTPVINFNLLRDTLNVGNWINIGIVSGTQTSLNDPNYTTYQSLGNWRVEATGFSCSPTVRLANNSIQTAIVKSKSNITNNRVTTVKQLGTGSQVTVYPNPSNGILNIRSGVEITTAIIEIYNVIGEKVVSEKMLGQSAQVNISDLSAGMYQVHLINKGVLIYQGKVVKQ